MKKVLMVFLFLMPVFALGLPAMYHVYETKRILDIMRIPAKYQQLQMFHRAIDTVPGFNVPGGWYHRERWGHDLGSLKELLNYDNSGLSASQKKIAWAIHVLQDSKTKVGVPHESIVEARKILSKEIFKNATISSLKYISILSIIDFIYQIAFLDVDAWTALKNVVKNMGISISLTTGVDLLVSITLPYIYSQSGRFLSFLPSGLLGPITYMSVDIVLRTIKSGSFTKALFSPETLLNAFVTVLFFVPGGQFIAPIAAAAGMVFSWIYHKIKIKHVKEVFNEEYDKHLLIQAEASVR
ncbi:MAG TPA: hypothetical protein DEA58_06275 [Pseudothermotoga sp.]|jgi:hypothetical protein|nr:MAG: hypothetical protein XD53_0830 [Petrotoga mobilis]HBT26277.1 hypothetical protein [Pseudothermotoga sp.]